MKPLVRKMSSLKLLKVELILGIVFSAVAMIGIPVSIFCLAPDLLREPLAWGIVLLVILFFGLVGYFRSVRPYRMYLELPDVQAEYDDKFLYIHGKKSAKIPLSDLEDAYIDFTLPFIYSKEFVAMLVVHLTSEKYGDLVLEVPGYGKFKMHFVADVQATAYSLARFVGGASNNSGVEEIIF